MWCLEMRGTGAKGVCGYHGWAEGFRVTRTPGESPVSVRKHLLGLSAVSNIVFLHWLCVARVSNAHQYMSTHPSC